MDTLNKIRTKAAFIGTLALVASGSACSGEGAAIGADEPFEATEEVDLTSADIERRLDEEGTTPELVALVRGYNAESLARSGLIYSIEIGEDHDLYVLEPEPGVIAYAERSGPAADSVQDVGELTDLRPTELFRRYNPGAAVPHVLVEAEARMPERVEAPADGPTEWLETESAEDSGFAGLQDELVDKHSTSSGAHFRDDAHDYGGVVSRACEAWQSTTTQQLCWTNRTSGGFSQFKSTHATWYFGLFRGNTGFRIFEHGNLMSDTMILQGELWRFTRVGKWHCPGLFCSYYGHQAVTRKAEWNGSNKDWHFAAHYQDILRR